MHELIVQDLKKKKKTSNASYFLIYKRTKGQR